MSEIIGKAKRDIKEGEIIWLNINSPVFENDAIDFNPDGVERITMMLINAKEIKVVQK